MYFGFHAYFGLFSNNASTYHIVSKFRVGVSVFDLSFDNLDTELSEQASRCGHMGFSLDDRLRNRE